jgi:hypothetical protein
MRRHWMLVRTECEMMSVSRGKKKLDATVNSADEIRNVVSGVTPADD